MGSVGKSNNSNMTSPGGAINVAEKSTEWLKTYDENMAVATKIAQPSQADLNNWQNVKAELQNRADNAPKPAPKRKAAQPSLKVPADYKGHINQTAFSQYLNQNKLQRLTSAERSELKPGTKVIVSDSIVRHVGLSSRRDPDGVSFARGTYMGTTQSNKPIVQLENGRKVVVETEYPYEDIYKRKS